MADEDDAVATDGEKKGKKKLIIIVAAVVVVAGIATAALLLFGGSEPAAPAAEGGAADTSAAVNGPTGPAAGDAIYVGMPRPFVFNVPGDERDRMVQIKVQLLVRGTNNEELSKRHIPLIEGTLLQAFSSMTADELQTEAGKERIRALGLERVRSVLTEVAGTPVIDEVLFTGFVLQ